MTTIWRDDDVLWKPTDLDALLYADDILQRHGALHTIAVIASRLTREVGRIIRERGMSAQLHCWDHDDLSVNVDAVAQLPAAVARMEDMIGTRPTVLYPPWNRSSEMLQTAAARLRLKVSTRKASLEQFIRFRGSIGEDTINFHHWHAPDVELLDVALRYAKP